MLYLFLQAIQVVPPKLGLAIFVILESKHGGQLLNEIFVYSKDVTDSKFRIFESMGNFSNDYCCPQTTNVFKNSYSRHLRIVNAVISMIASRSDRVTQIYFSSNGACHVKTMSTTVNEVNNDITKVLDEFIFRRVLLVCFNA